MAGRQEGMMAYPGYYGSRRSKYGNKKVDVDGIEFDSMAEANRYVELRMMEKLGEIRDLRRQVPFVLITGQRWGDGKKHRDTVYKADFVYIDNETGQTVVEDVKGFKTDAYKIKRELMKDRHGIEIKEVRV